MKRTATAYPYISEKEVWPEILKYLPVKTLGKFRSVCKFWNELIVSQKFMNEHFDSYTQNEDNALLLYRQFSRRPLKREEYTVFVDSVQGSVENLQVRHTFTCPFLPGVNCHYYFRIIGCVNGLVCISDDDPKSGPCVVLWNPLIHRYIKLPKVSNFGHIPIFGFGYDTHKRDYKVVRIDYFVGLDYLVELPPRLLIQIYSVQERKWRAYENIFFQTICICEKWWSQCFVDEYICWMAWVRDLCTLAIRKSCVLTFHVEREEFDVLSLPTELASVSPLELRVCEYKGKLAVALSKMKRRFTGNDMELFELWVYSGFTNNTWNKEYSFKLNSQDNTLNWIQCSLKNGDLLGFTAEGELASFDIKTKDTKRLGLFGRRRSWFTASFTESLVLLDGQSGASTYDEAGRQGNKRYKFSDQDILTVEEEAADNSTEDEDGQDITSWALLTLEHQLEQLVGGDDVKLRDLLAGHGI